MYPIKSAAGIPVSRAGLDGLGLRHDRRWMLVDHDGDFLSQRRLARMALISVSFRGGALLVEASGMPALTLPLEPAPDDPRQRIPVRVFDDVVSSAPSGDEADRWFSGFLGVRCRLVYMPDDVVRPVDPRYARDGDRVGFADGFPLLMFSEASLADLNSRLPEPVPENRFRPNLVVSGCEAFAEDGWRRVCIGEVGLRVAKPCSRCAITTVDQATGISGKEPLRTLASYRKAGDKVNFGQNLAYDGAGELRVGDAVEVG